MQNGVFQTGNPRWSAVFSLFMGVMALIELVRGTPLNLGHSAEVE